MEEACECSNNAPSAGAASAVGGKTVHKNIGKDTAMLGREFLKEKYSIAVRSVRTGMSAEKCLLRECIVNALSKSNNHRSVIFSISTSLVGSW